MPVNIDPNEVQDWYIPANGEVTVGHVFARDGAHPINGSTTERALSLQRQCEQSAGDWSWKLRDGDQLYRAQRMPSATLGGDLIHLRRINPVRLDIKTLGLPRGILDLLLSPALASGLVLIVGETGSGKSTTAAATVHARMSRIPKQFALTIEDPVEYVLPGHYPETKGLLYQWSLSGDDDEYAIALRRALRCCPSGRQSTLFLGELRDDATAWESLRASLSGHLVITTLHASGIQDALQRITMMAGQQGDTRQASMALAGGLRMVIYQSLDDSQRLQARVLWVGQQSEGIRAHIRKEQIPHLQTEIQAQNNLLMLGTPLI